MKKPHPVQAGEPIKVKKLKIRVARKPDLIEPNWVYSFSSFIRLYQTRIVRSILFLGCWTVIMRILKFCNCLQQFKYFINDPLQELITKYLLTSGLECVILDLIFWGFWARSSSRKFNLSTHKKYSVKREKSGHPVS